jgi:hypothetical protein
MNSLTAESVQSASLPLEGIDNIHGGDGLPLGVFSVGDSIPDDVLQENLEDTAGLFVDEARDTLDTSTASQTPDGGLGDALDVIPEHLPVPLGTSLAESLSSLSASGHVDRSVKLNASTVYPANIYRELALQSLGNSSLTNRKPSFSHTRRDRELDPLSKGRDNRWR